MSVRRLASADRQPASFAFTEENARFAEVQIAKYPEGRQASAVIPLLWQAQKQSGGWLPQKAIEAVAAELGMPLIRVMEVATFYTMFNLEPVGRFFVQLCGTVPCHVKGAIDLKQVLLEKVGDPLHVTPDGNFSWLEVECLGACCNAPMVQINDDYYEDLTPDLLIGVLDDLAARRPVTPGPQNGRIGSAPEGGPDTLSDPALFDGSLIGSWRARFKEQGGADGPETGEGETASCKAANDPIPAKPGDTHAYHKASSDTPAQRVKNDEPPIKPGDRGAPPQSGKATPAEQRSPADGQPPQSSKSYTAIPSKPEDGRIAAGPQGSTPVSGAPGESEPTRHDGSQYKPVGADKDASPGVAPKE